MRLRIHVTSPDILARPDIAALADRHELTLSPGEPDLVIGPAAWHLTHDHLNEGLLDVAMKAARAAAAAATSRTPAVRPKPPKAAKVAKKKAMAAVDAAAAPTEPPVNV